MMLLIFQFHYELGNEPREFLLAKPKSGMCVYTGSNAYEIYSPMAISQMDQLPITKIVPRNYSVHGKYI